LDKELHSIGECCSVRGIFKSFSEYHNRKDTKDKHANQCKGCRAVISKTSIQREQTRQPVYINGEVKLCEELSLPELKTLQKGRKIVLDGHYTKNELVKLLK
jgi:uncharacterized Zn finger protein